jgi:nucleotide-binding universal stress UspA family protein
MIPARTILAPVDFSEASRASLRYAARLAARWRAALHVVHVVEPLLAVAAQTHRIDIVADTRDELNTFCRASGVPAEIAPTLDVIVGAPAAAICEQAALVGADLIVAGSRGLSGLNRVMMGSTVEHVIRGAHTSVLTVPGRHPADEVTDWGPVVAAIDDPERGDGLMSAAAAIAKSLDADLHLVHVVPPLPMPARWQAEAEAIQHGRGDDARRHLTAALQRLGDGIAPSNVHVSKGNVADALAVEASRHTRSLPILVLGRAEPGRGPAPGSVASRVIARATAAVWVYLPRTAS